MRNHEQSVSLNSPWIFLLEGGSSLAGSCQFISFVGFASSSRPHSPTAHSMSEKPLIKHVDIFAHMWPPKLFFKKTKIHHDNINMDSLDSAVHIDTYRTYHVKSQISYIYIYVCILSYHIKSSHVKSYHFTSHHFLSIPFTSCQNYQKSNISSISFNKKNNTAPFECPWLLGAP